MIGDLFTDGHLCLSMREASVVIVDVNYRHCPGKSSTTFLLPKVIR